MVRNGIPKICIYFGSTEQNSELFSLPQKGSEQNYGSSFLLLVHGTEFRVVFSSAEGFGTEFQEFLFLGTTGIPSEITICSVYSVFRGIIFLSEIPNPNPGPTPSNAPSNGFARIKTVNCCEEKGIIGVGGGLRGRVGIGVRVRDVTKRTPHPPPAVCKVTLRTAPPPPHPTHTALLFRTI
jgi:hypothetical protein